MGEWSKKLGEHGEDIVESLMNLIGWKAPLKGIDLDCIKPTPHSLTGTPRKEHGVDFIFSCVSPLEDDVLKHLLISSKFTGTQYPASPASTFKDHFVNLATALECFKRSPQKKKINSSYQGVSSESLAGVLFWLSGTDAPDADLVQKIANSRGLDDYSYGTIYLVDNYRASFLFDSITYVKTAYKPENTKFIYPSTGKNVSPITRLTTGTILPAEYLNSGLIPFFAIQSDKKILIICCQDPFSEEALKRLMGFSLTIALDYPDKVVIAFPDYSYVRHHEAADMAKLTLANTEFASIVEVTSYQSDFRGSAQ
ncbi:MULTISPECIES: hypothetical protein [unclassified Pseudomonas]|uniref:GapS4a family protein n=1 Tax=unclassified Pseudomonas TaxID=196821 RepID=UPI001B32DA5D|nr:MULTISPECIES: hypothetical protein [unclassified Pseudomonas]